MENFFWLDEENRNIFHLVRFARFPKEKNNAVKDPVVYYHQTDDWPAESPVGMWMDYGLVNQFLKEWEVRREQLVKGEITNAEYFECKRLINTRSKYTNYSVPIKVGLEHFTPAYWKSGALFRALAFHRSILSFLTRA